MRKKHFRNIKKICTVHINSVYEVEGVAMHDYFMESVKLQRIDFFLRLVADSECSDEEKILAIQWMSELCSDLVVKLKKHEKCLAGQDTIN